MTDLITIFFVIWYETDFYTSEQLNFTCLKVLNRTNQASKSKSQNLSQIKIQILIKMNPTTITSKPVVVVASKATEKPLNPSNQMLHNVNTL